MSKNRKKGFTLVELLAVIAVLGLILIIAVPKVQKTMDNSKKKTLELTVKSIARSAEEAYIENSSFEMNNIITCESVSEISTNEYETCEIDFDEKGKAFVTYVGKGKYDGLRICDGTKVDAVAITKECPKNFEYDEWITIIDAVKSGKYPYQVGDTKTIEMDIDDNGLAEEYTIRIANTTKCSEVSVASQTACGFVLEFTDVITTHVMNAQLTNAGGWPKSDMRTYVNETIYNLLPGDLKKGIIDTYVISGQGGSDVGTLDNGNFESTDKIYLLSTEEVWQGFDKNSDKSIETSRQLDYYANYQGEGYIGVSKTNKVGAIKSKNSSGAASWWLRSATPGNTGNFNRVIQTGELNGNAYYCNSNMNDGVSPAFRLAN